jgi:hypothetical protein
MSLEARKLDGVTLDEVQPYAGGSGGTAVSHASSLSSAAVLEEAWLGPRQRHVRCHAPSVSPKPPVAFNCHGFHHHL